MRASSMWCAWLCALSLLHSPSGLLHTRRETALLKEESKQEAALRSMESSVQAATHVLESALLVSNSSTLNIGNSSHGSTHLNPDYEKKLVEQKKLLTNMFAHLKGQISDYNKNEGAEKTASTERVERIKARLDADRAKLAANTSLSKFERELLTNRTLAEETELKYWTTGRALEHNMFHSNLKLAHAMMSRVKSIMGAYSEVLTTGKLSSETEKGIKDSIVAVHR